MDKLKNKKKDVISLDNQKIQIPQKDPDQQMKNDNSEMEEVKTNPPQKQETDSKEISEPQKIKESENVNNVIKKILFKIQLLLSMTSKIDAKLIGILSQVLSEEHIKGILEERDCRGICGNVSCGSKIKTKDKDSASYQYNYTSKDFSKDNVLDFFCDVRCYQKFKEILIITKNFDYLRLLNIETVYLFSILKEFYSDNSYLEEISVLADQILSNQKIQGEYYAGLKEKYTNFFSNKQ